MRLLFLLLLPALCYGQAYSFKDLPFLRSQVAGGTLANGITAYWKLDDAANGTRVDSVGSENLTDANGNVGAIAGIINNGINTTPGAATRILGHVDDATLGIGAGVSFTISAWHQVDGTHDTGIVTKWNLGNAALEDYQLYVGASGNFGNGFVAWTVKNLAGTAVTIVSNVQQQNTSSCSATHFINTVCGYDDALQQIWMQVNNGPRIVAACVGVRRTACDFVVGSYMDGTTMGLAVDEVGFWRRSLTLQEVATLNNSCNGLAFASFPTATSGTANITLGTYTSTWWQTVYNNASDASNNGGSVGNTTLIALNTLYSTVSSAGLLSKTKSLNLFVFDNIVAAMWPFIGAGGAQPSTKWVNTGFGSGDLSVNGLTGNGSSTFINVGISSTTLWTQDDSSVAIYAYNIIANTGYEFGYSNDLGTDNASVRLNRSDILNDFIGVMYDGSAGSVSVANSGNGYYCLSRTSSALLKGYFASSVSAHAQIGSTYTGSSGTLVAHNPYVFAMNHWNAGLPFGFSADTLSAVFIGAGLSSADDLALYNAIQAYLVAKGGGFR